jgi:hypothetical protein
MRMILAILMVLHGVAHLPGFVNEWRLASLEGLPYRTTILAGRLDLGEQGIRVVGTLWLAAAIAFWAAGAGAFADRPWWIPVAALVALASLVLSLVELPEAKIGVLVNLVILAGLFIASRLAPA